MAGLTTKNTLVLDDGILSVNAHSASFSHDYVYLGNRATVGVRGPVPDLTVNINSPGLLGRGFGDLWYNRIHFTPYPLAIGSVASNTTRTVEVWNAFSVPRSLQSLSLNNVDGITLQGGLPVSFTALEAKNLTLAINKDGTPFLDGSVIFNFDLGISAALAVNGQRASLFAFDHNWSSRITERLAWKTEVLTARNGKEQRRRLRSNPRRSLRYDYFTEDKKQTSYFKKHQWKQQANRIAVPIWSDMQALSSTLASGSIAIPVSTAGRDFDNDGMVALWQSPFSYELLRISTVAANQVNLTGTTAATWNAGTIVVPVRTANYPADLQRARPTSQNLQNQIEVRIYETETSIKRYTLPTPTLYRGLGCFDFYSETSDVLDDSIQREIELLDNEIGISQLYANWDRAQGQVDFRWFAIGRTEIAQMLGWLYYFAGKLNPVWRLTWEHDFELAATIANNAQVFDVTDWGYRDTYNLEETKRDIAIILKSGAIHRRRITAAVASGTAGRETLTVDAPITPAVTLSDIDRICFMNYTRMAADEVEIEWVTSQCAIAKWKFIDLTTTL